MSWPKVPIKTVCTGIYDGPHATPPESDSGAIFLGISNFNNGRLDLSDIRHISEKDYGNLLDLFGVLIFDVQALPENHHACLLALLHLAAFLLTLLKGDVFAGTTEKHLIEKAVGFAGCVADSVSGADPRLFPRDNPIFELFHDAIRDFLIKIHFSCSFLLRGEQFVW